MREFDIAEAFAEDVNRGQAYGPARGAYEKAQKNVARLQEEIDRLLQRVKPALAPEVPLPGSGIEAGRDAPAGSSEVTGSFLDLADQIDRAAQRVNAITSRVEL